MTSHTPAFLENFWRPVFEFNQSIAWFAGATASYFVGTSLNFPYQISEYALLGFSAIGAYRFYEAFGLWKRQDALLHTPVVYQSSSSLARFARKKGDNLFWLGRGFEWKPIHAQRAYQLTKLDVKSFKPALPFYLYNLIVRKRLNSSGSPWIHGLELENHNIVPKRKGHTVAFGITGSGKTRLAELMVTQSIHAGDVVIVIDPKGDTGLRDRMLYEAIKAGREKDFAFFSPGHPGLSVSFDPLKNFTRVTQIASRIVALLRTKDGDDAFIAFAWRALNIITQALVEIDQSPNLILLRRYIEGGIDILIDKVITSYLERIGVSDIDEQLKPYINKVKKQPNSKPLSSTPDRSHAIVTYYLENIPEKSRSDVVDGLINMYQHGREHFQKMITNLIPTLNMLTSGDLRELLSPDPNDIDDTRERLDSSRVMSRTKIIYMALDSLADGTIGSAIGSIILSDLTSVAADIYNHESEDKRKRLSIYIDEAAEVVNAPTVQLLNKSRGANFYITLLSQSYPDFIARTGNEPMARQILANCGNLISLRTPEENTQKYCVESFGKTTVKQQMHTQSTTPVQNKDLSNWGGGTGERLVETEYDLFSSTLLGKLPDLHYIASFDGGVINKGTIPILSMDKGWKFEDHWPPKNKPNSNQAA